jgi:beta-glucosidase-like glycosyl hydrolase
VLNGKPTCANPELKRVLRDWGFDGYITSDTDSCGDIHTSHSYEPTGELATSDCLKGGTDIDSGSTYGKYLLSALQAGTVSRAYVDEALSNAYRARMEMGMFDPWRSSPLDNISAAEVGMDASQKLSLLAAKKAMVLLKNDGRILPFAKGKRVAIIGRAVDDASSLTGNYNGPLCAKGGDRPDPDCR